MVGEIVVMKECGGERERQIRTTGIRKMMMEETDDE